MKAFIAILLVAAVSGQITTGVDRNVFDYIRYRQLYPQGKYQRGVEGLLNDAVYGNGAQTGVQGQVYGDLTTGFVPSTQQINNIQSYYTLSQLYNLPIFQEYLTLPLFRQYFTAPAFQRFLVSQYFQQYFTLPIFQRFFLDPVLFYRYIYPVVLQFQTGATTVDQTLVVPEIYRHLVPEVYRSGVVPKTYNTGIYGNQIYTTGIYGNGVLPQTYTNGVYGNGAVPQTYTNGVYGNGAVPQTYTNDIYRGIVPETYRGDFASDIFRGVNTYSRRVIPEVYGNGVYTTEQVRRALYPQVFGYGKVYDNNILRNLVGNTLNTGIYGKVNGNNQVYGKVFGNNELFGKVYGNNELFGKVYGNNEIYGNTEGVVLERIFKGLLDGKINIDELKGQTELLGEKINKFVNPMTGDFKIVDEKIVKPTIVEGEQANDVFLNKVLLKKQTFNKL